MTQEEGWKEVISCTSIKLRKVASSPDEGMFGKAEIYFDDIKEVEFRESGFYVVCKNDRNCIDESNFCEYGRDCRDGTDSAFNTNDWRDKQAFKKVKNALKHVLKSSSSFDGKIIDADELDDMF